MATYTDDSALPKISDETLTAALPDARPYTVVILKAGPNFSMPGPDRDSEAARIVWEHGKRNFALRASGLMPIVCPVRDGSGVTGVAIFDAAPLEVERIMSGDPGVKVGFFTFEIHPTFAFPGSSLPG